MQRQISSREFQELLAFDKYEGIPDPWEMTDRICAAILAAAGAEVTVGDVKRARRPASQLID